MMNIYTFIGTFYLVFILILPLLHFTYYANNCANEINVYKNIEDRYAILDFLMLIIIFILNYIVWGNIIFMIFYLIALSNKILWKYYPNLCNKIAIMDSNRYFYLFLPIIIFTTNLNM